MVWKADEAALAEVAPVTERGSVLGEQASAVSVIAAQARCFHDPVR
jgi:hypothetical protein